jgi:prolyl oligopeptidase
MKKIVSLISIIAVSHVFSQNNKMHSITYPTTQKGETLDNYFNIPVADPYRWLEDDRSAETAAWVKSQNELTYDYLSKIPFREALKSRMEKIWNFEKISAPFQEGNSIYYYKNNGLQNQSVLNRKDSKGVESVFLDPNSFSQKGTTSLAGVDFSKDGSKVAYSISEGGSDWRKIIIMDTESGKILEDTLVDVKFSGISWKANEGFYYSSYDNLPKQTNTNFIFTNLVRHKKKIK